MTGPILIVEDDKKTASLVAHGGAGIGLAIVKELIEAHNGRIGAEIRDNEIRIWFTLPLQEP